TAGNGPLPFGTDNVPGRIQGSAPTVTSRSVKAPVSTYVAGVVSGVGTADGTGLADPFGTTWPKCRPPTSPVGAIATSSCTVAVANSTGRVTVTNGGCDAVVAVEPSDWNAPYCVTSWLHS